MPGMNVTRPFTTAVFITGWLTGCAALHPETDRAGPPSVGADGLVHVVCSGTATPEQQVELDAIDELIASSQPYGALARLETLPFSTQRHWLRWAQLMGKVDQLQLSEQAYRAIADACDSAEAYHGLGVVLLKTERTPQGLEALRQAKARDPASASIRNDLGIALLREGLYGQAAFELRTAYELSASQQGIARSMVAAYYLQGGEKLAKELQAEVGLPASILASGIDFSRQFVLAR